MIAIVTGANGFIGKALCNELAQNGHEVIAVTREICPMEEIHKLPDIINKKADVFFHLAWAGSTGADRADYEKQLLNVKWTLDAVEVAKAMGCQRFVGAGTLAELDVNAYQPVDGSTPNAVSNYGVAKISAHYMSKAQCNKLGIEHTWAYLSNTFGPGNFTGNFINFAAKTMITGAPCDFTPGEQPYDFVFVSDTAKGLRCIGESGKANYAYYIGSGASTKLKEFVIKLRDAVDPDIKLNLGAIPFNGTFQPAEVYDCTKLMEHTGYKPSTTFEEGLEITVPWIREQIAKGNL